MRILLIGLTGIALAACNGSAHIGSRSGTVVEPQGSGNMRIFPARAFTAVELRGADDVEVTTGGDFGVRAQGDPDRLDMLEIRIDGDRLIVGRKDRARWKWREDGDLRIQIAMPMIRRGSLSGSGDLTVNRVQGDFAADLSGSGDLTIGILQGGKGDFSIAGSGTIATSGRIDRFDLSIVGSGNFDAAELSADGAAVTIAGSGDARARVNGDASVRIVGSGDVDLGPDARCKVSRLGSGAVRCGGGTG